MPTVFEDVAFDRMNMGYQRKFENAVYEALTKVDMLKSINDCHIT